MFLNFVLHLLGTDAPPPKAFKKNLGNLFNMSRIGDAILKADMLTLSSSE